MKLTELSAAIIRYVVHFRWTRPRGARRPEQTDAVQKKEIDEMFAWVSYRCLMIGRRLNLITHDHAVQTFL